MKIIISVLIAALFFLLLKALKLGTKRLMNHYPGINIINRLFIAFGFILWMTYIFWVLHYLFRDKFYYQYLFYSLMLVVIGFLAWFLAKDIIAGIIFSFKNNFKEGSYISIGNISGQIKTQHLTYLKLLKDDGQVVRLPFSGIIHEVITELAFKGSHEEYIIIIKADLSLGKGGAEELIRKAMLNAPWISIKEDPVINFRKEDINGFVFEIKLVSKNLNHLKNIEMSLDKIPSLHLIS